MKAAYCQRIKEKRSYSSISINVIHKALIAISVYIIFGQLFQYVYANTNTNDSVDPYQTTHGSVWLLADNGIYIEAMQIQTDVDYEVTGSIARAKVKQLEDPRYRTVDHFEWPLAAGLLLLLGALLCEVLLFRRVP